MSTAIKKPGRETRVYSVANLPESDGKPMGESHKHIQQIIETFNALREYFRSTPKMLIHANMFVYFLNRIGTLKRVAPDIFVVRDGVPDENRRVYSIEEEGNKPDLVIEFTSKGTRKTDLGKKRKIYAWLEIKEYFLFDPFAEYIKSGLNGFRLIGGEYVPLHKSDSATRLHSEVLGLDLSAEGGFLRFYDPKTGERLRTHEEAEAERRHANEKALRESAARHDAETELARLKDELKRLRKNIR